MNRSIRKMVAVLLIVVMGLSSSVLLYAASTPPNTAITKLKNSGKQQITVAVKRASGASGYEITYSPDKNFGYSKFKCNTASLNKTIKDLAPGKTYYVKVRAYKGSGSQKVYGNYSTVKSIKVSSINTNIKVNKPVSGVLNRVSSMHTYKLDLAAKHWFGVKVYYYSNYKGKEEWILSHSTGLNTLSDFYQYSTDEQFITYKSPWFVYTPKYATPFFSGKQYFSISVPEYMFEKEDYKLYYKIVLDDSISSGL